VTEVDAPVAPVSTAARIANPVNVFSETWGSRNPSPSIDVPNGSSCGIRSRRTGSPGVTVGDSVSASHAVIRVAI
jgi:hypothetical protein